MDARIRAAPSPGAAPQKVYRITIFSNNFKRNKIIAAILYHKGAWLWLGFYCLPDLANDVGHNEVATRISLDPLDLICEALGCELTDLIVLTPNSEPRVKTRTGAPRSKGED